MTSLASPNVAVASPVRRILLAKALESVDDARVLRWIKQASLDAALEAFERYVQDKHLGKKDLYPECDKAGLREVKCEAIRKRLKSKALKREQNRTTLDLVVYLIGGKREDHTTSVAPPGNQLPLGLKVDCPSETHDHRVIVLGQLPQPDSYAAVFVQPKGAEMWWPQHHKLQPDPRAGLAFMVSAHLGNPQAQHQEKLPLDFIVRVCAVEKAWSDDSSPRTWKAIESQLLTLGEIAREECKIRRKPGFEQVTLTSGTKTVRVTHPAVHVVKAPVIISWGGLAQGSIEIRLAFQDIIYAHQDVTSRVKLTLPRGKTRPKTKEEFRLGQAGTYRVRLYPRRRPFVDALYEWWLDIS